MTHEELPPRFQEGGLGRFVEAFCKAYPNNGLTFEQVEWIENYYVNAMKKELA